ncbi:MAG: hypothetical protein KatS3mg113_0790 [Planctomycetaceae bacterium]|nr:MAG: hypothetical protein KatS3mg113_0790 [Planctomycetaceae bacterium]
MWREDQVNTTINQGRVLSTFILVTALLLAMGGTYFLFTEVGYTRVKPDPYAAHKPAPDVSKQKSAWSDGPRWVIDAAEYPVEKVPLPEAVSAWLPLNDLTEDRVAAYWGITPEIVERVQRERSLTLEHLAVMPEKKVRRAVWRLDHPKSDHPGEAHAWRALRYRDDRGRIPPDGLIRALQQREALLKRQRPGMAAGLPVGSHDVSGAELRSQDAGISPGSWTWLGPGNIGGRTRGLVIHPTNPNIMYAATVGGGLWMTSNGGGSWQPLTGFAANLAACCIVMHPLNPNVLYVGTGEGFYNIDAIRGAGIFITSNGGNTWTQLSSTNNGSFYYVNRLAISPNGNVLLAATNSGLFRSTDGGNTWTTPSGGVNVRMLDCDFHPTDSTRCICSSSGARVWYSTNGGLSWTSATGLSSTTDGFAERTEICYARANPNIVYASVDRSNGAIFRSTDGGQSFSLRGTHGHLASQGWYDNIIWAGDPNNADRVIVGGVDLFRSVDGGQTLAQISQWWLAPASAHADHHEIATPPTYNGTTNQTLIFANDGGVYRGSNVWGTVSWQELNNNLGCTQFYGASAHPTAGIVYGGTQDNGTLRYNGNTEGWIESFGGDGGFSASDPTDPLYHYGEYIYLQIHRSSNGGTSANYIYSGIADAGSGSSALFISPFILDPNNPNRMLAGGARLWRSDDVKAPTPSWSSIKPVASSLISAIAVNPLNSDHVWVGHTNGDIYLSTNGTSAIPSWSKVDSASMPNRYVERIAVDPVVGTTVYVAFGGFNSGNLWKTTNNGATWSNITGSLPQAPINGIAIHPIKNTWIYVGTEVGVFASENGGATWSATNQGPVNVAVDEVFFSGGRLYAVTHGRGIYSAVPTIAAPTPQMGTIQVTWLASARRLTLTGDSYANQATLHWRNNRVTIVADRDTRLYDGSRWTSTLTINTGTGAIDIQGDLGAGDDKLSFINAPINRLSLRLEDGNDNITVNYCTITRTACDGGPGADTFINVASSISSNSNINFP